MTRPRSNALATGAPISVEGHGILNFKTFTGDYAPAPGNPDFLTAWIGSKRVGHPMKGWKLHITAYPRNANLIAQTVLPILYDMKIWHKYIKSPLLLSKMTDGQRGKFITVYTRDNDDSPGAECSAVVAAVSPALADDSIEGPPVAHERCLAKMIYGRRSFDYTKPGE